MQTSCLSGNCPCPCDCSILNIAPCPPRAVSYQTFCELGTEQNLSLCVIEKIAGSCSIPKPWVPCIAIPTPEPTSTIVYNTTTTTGVTPTVSSVLTSGTVTFIPMSTVNTSTAPLQDDEKIVVIVVSLVIVALVLAAMSGSKQFGLDIKKKLTHYMYSAPSLQRHPLGYKDFVCRSEGVVIGSLFLCMYCRKHKWDSTSKIYHIQIQATRLTAVFQRFSHKSQPIADVKLTYENSVFTIELPPMKGDTNDNCGNGVTTTNSFAMAELEITNVEIGHVDPIITEQSGKSCDKPICDEATETAMHREMQKRTELNIIKVEPDQVETISEDGRNTERSHNMLAESEEECGIQNHDGHSECEMKTELNTIQVELDHEETATSEDYPSSENSYNMLAEIEEICDVQNNGESTGIEMQGGFDVLNVEMDYVNTTIIEEDQNSDSSFHKLNESQAACDVQNDVSAANALRTS